MGIVHLFGWCEKAVGRATEIGRRQALVTFAAVLGVLLFVLSSIQVSSAQVPQVVTYNRVYDLGNAGHIDDLGLIDGKRHLVIQQSGEICIIEVSTTGFTVRAQITNPLSGDWGHMLTVVPDVNGDGVNDIATYGRDSQITGEYVFYMLSGNHLSGSVVDGNSAAIYTIPFGQVQPRYASAKPGSNEILLTEFPDTSRRRNSVTGEILHTVTGPVVANGGIWVGDFDGDSVPDYLTGGESPLYIISGVDTTDGSAASRAILTLSDTATPSLGYAEDNNNIAAAIGDVNGDGTSEIAVGSRLYRIDPDGTNYGRVVVFDGATGSVLYRIEPDQTHTNGVFFGDNIVATGDMNGDGIGDFIVSARGYSQTPGGFGDGAIIAFSGANGAKLFRRYGNQEMMGYYELTLIGDLNADGIPDLAVGSLLNGSIWLSGFEPPATTVAIDIKPGSFQNSINPRSKGKVSVAVLTTETFNATTVDPTTARFGRTGTEAAPVHAALEDVDGDGDADLILHFNTQATGIKCGDIAAFLTGETFSRQMIEGSDSVKTAGCK